jgi:hypothetical protein
MKVIMILVTWGVIALPLKEILSRDLREEGKHKKSKKDALTDEKGVYQDC